MSTRNNLSRVTIDIPAMEHKKLKAMATLLGKSMREIILESIEARLHDMNRLNKETLKAIEDIEKGKDLVEAKDLEDFFKKLRI